MSGGSLVFHKDGKPLDYRYIQFAYDKAFKKAALPFSATHVMRRTGTSWVLDSSGGDVGLAKQILGNSDWATVALYAKRQSNALREFNDKLWDEHENKKKVGKENLLVSLFLLRIVFVFRVLNREQDQQFFWAINHSLWQLLFRNLLMKEPL